MKPGPRASSTVPGVPSAAASPPDSGSGPSALPPPGARLLPAGIAARMTLIAAVVVLPLIAANLLQIAGDRDAARNAAYADSTRLAETVGTAIEEEFAGTEQVLIAVSWSHEVRSLAAASCTGYLERLLREYPNLTSLAVADRNGAIVCSGLPSSTAVSVADRSYFKRAMAEGTFVVGEYQIGRIVGRPVIVGALPITDGGEIIGIVFASVSVDHIQSVAVIDSLPGAAALTIIDRTGTVVARQPDPEAWAGKHLPDAPLVRRLLEHGARPFNELETAELEGFTGAQQFFALHSVQVGDDRPLHLSIGFSVDETYAIADRGFWSAMATLLVAMVVAGIGLAWTARRLLLRPVRRLSSVARELAGGDLEVRTGIQGGGEIGELAAAFDAMAASVQDRVEARTADLSAALAELQEQDARLAEQAALLDGTSDALYIIDPESLRILHASQGATAQLGYTRDELLTMTALDNNSVSEDDFRAGLEPLLDGRVEDLQTESRHRRRDGSELEVEVRLRAIRPDGGALRLVASVRDISARIEAERRIRDYLDIAVDPLVVARAVRSEAGAIMNFEQTFANEPATRVLGGTLADAAARIGADAHSAAARLRAFGAVVTTGRAIEYEAAFPDVDTGESRDFLVRVTKVGDGVAVAFRDITGAKQLQRALESARNEAEVARAAAESARAEAERANQSKTEFLSRMSHELRTPLNAVIGFAQLLEMDGLGGEQRESVAHILGGGRHLLELINEVLDISRLEAGTLSISREPVNVDEAIRDAVGLIMPLARERDLPVRVEDHPAGPYHVEADRQRLQQVLLNLLSNAVKFNRPGGSITVSVSEAGPNRCRIAVRDEGGGIPDALRSRVFVPFDRLGAESTAIQGTGLGLAFSRALMERMGGEIGFDSVPREGSTFWIELARTSAPATRRRQAGRACTRKPARAGTILYVEDNLPNVELVRRLLAKRGAVEVIPAMLGSLGLELARKHHPDLILLDLHLPDMGGFEVMDRLQADPATRDIPVVVLSADASPGVIESIRARGAREFITKPIDVGEFLAVVDRLLGGPEGGSQPARPRTAGGSRAAGARPARPRPSGRA